MAGNDDDDGVAVVGHADGAERFVVADLHGDMSVGAGFAVGDGLQRLPDGLLEGRSGGCERQREVAARAGEILPELRRRLQQQGCGGGFGDGRGAFRNCRAETDLRHSLARSRDRHGADGRFELQCVRHKFFRV